MSRWPSLLLLFAIGVCGSAYAQTVAGSETAGAEFPPNESQLFSIQQRGLAAVAASEAFARQPDAVETLKLLLAQDRIDDAIAVARRILATRPERVQDAVSAIAAQNYRFHDQARGHPDALQQIAEQARVRLPALPREDAARLARQIIMIDHRQPSAPGANPFDEMLAEFMKEYAGTEEALLTEIDVMIRGRASWDQIQKLDDFARAHSGTVAGAKALETEGFQLAVNIPVSGVERRGSDPTERFLRVVAIANELESGSYPRCEWVEHAPGVVMQFFASNPTFAPGNVDRMAAEYIAFARAHLNLNERDPISAGVGYFLTTRMMALYKTEGDPVPHVERALDTLAGETGRPDIVYLKGAFYLRTSIDDPSQRTAMRTRAKATFRELAGSGTDLFHRKALATLAYLEFEDGDYTSALDHFTRYVERYPRSAYAWVASLRIAESHEALGDLPAAASSYRAAAENYRSIPLAQVLGHEYGARSLEGRGRLNQALNEHENALRAWDPDYGGEYRLFYGSSPSTGGAIAFEPARAVTRDGMKLSIRQLHESLSDPAGPLLEKGRWLLEREQRADATEALAELLRRFPASPLTGQARLLSHHARLESALALANVEAPARDAAGALNQLTALAGEPFDDAVCVAGIARATLLTKEHTDEARAAMRETLMRCRINGAAERRTKAPSGVEADVVAVRNAVFLPGGGGVYGSGGWNAFSWPATPPMFMLVSPTVAVKTADGAETAFVLRDSFPGLDNVVFFSGEQVHLLTGVMTALGGTKRFVPASVMATPNQPAGDAVNVRAFWDQFFPCRPGHWGGWEFEAYPRISSIAFLDAARTRAAVSVTIGYSGATVVLEKRDGVWRAVRLTNRWIT